ncbi:RICIN domain-containing protein [Streptomyces sp. MBT53]|uniref:RICIN domain-containing protein n=1 Tax=Streptomyces sp. MBT53 TaxID=1488384 RepID=UPI001913685A|nr:RICIN domain-containing protein [Streptomyces sp. MBT53]MBK6018041.1 ricin-type beta-trefoil lectin domain protein [Streptomyces sp. MBT53]
MAQLGDKAAGTRAVALLLARHWQATSEYAAICLATAESSASMVASAAFHQVLASRVTGGALRPQLLVAVREMVRKWAADERIPALLLAELRKPTGGRGLRAARPGTSERRKLAERAFGKLPGGSQCLLWHTEVEAEPITVPAGLLGVDEATATAALDQAREQFRAGCVRAHHELAPTPECRYYNRLLDVPIRRGGSLLPDVQRHLMTCRYCRFAAEQLSHFDGGLEVLLAETVLGWGARRYLDSRPGRATPGTAARAARRPMGRHRPAPDGVLAFPRRHPKTAVVGVGLTSLALLATVLVSKGWTQGDTPDPQATWGAPSSSSSHQSPVAVPSTAGDESAAGAVGAGVVQQGVMRALASGLCLDVAGGRVRNGAAVTLAACSDAGSQQWSYDQDGLLRSLDDPGLCLAADTDKGTVTLSGCLVHAGEVHYDLTVRGELLLRWSQGLAVTPENGKKGARIVLAGRDGSAGQRWALGSAADAGAEGDEPTDGGKTEGKGDAAPSGTPTAPEGGDVPQPLPTDVPQQDQPQNAPRAVQVACCEQPTPDPTPTPTPTPAPVVDALQPVVTVVGDVVNTVTGVIAGLVPARH